MRRQRLKRFLFSGCAIFVAGAVRPPALNGQALYGQAANQQPAYPAAAKRTESRRAPLSAPATLLHAARLSPSDLEITGMVSSLVSGAASGAAANSARYIRYADLLRLPQVSVSVKGDPNFAGQNIRVAGVELDVLARAIGALPGSGLLPGSDLIDALCADQYRSHFPASYIASHHPILALKIDGESTAKWAARTRHQDPGPYFITYAHFIPGYRVLSHVEEIQVPINIVRLNFSSTALTFGAIAPRGSFAADSPVQQGFAIAKQNCFRCHFQGPFGGAKSGRDWVSLGIWAREQPSFFARYVHDPLSIEPNAHMPGNPEYDASTLAALTAYFQTFASQGYTTRSVARKNTPAP